MSFVDFMVKYGITIMSVIATIISLIIAFLKAKKTGNSKGMVALLEKIPSLVTTAESLYGKGKGTAKLDYVLTQLRLYALQSNIKVDINDLTAQINSVVETTNNVNIDKQKIETQPSENTEGRVDTENNDNNTQSIIFN